jgi:hypothetical protein
MFLQKIVRIKSFLESKGGRNNKKEHSPKKEHKLEYTKKS